MRIVLAIFAVISITSIISLVLTFINFNDARDGIIMSKLALERMNSLRTIRPALRTIVNIANN